MISQVGERIRTPPSQRVYELTEVICFKLTCIAMAALERVLLAVDEHKAIWRENAGRLHIAGGSYAA